MAASVHTAPNPRLRGFARVSDLRIPQDAAEDGPNLSNSDKLLSNYSGQITTLKKVNIGRRSPSNIEDWCHLQTRRFLVDIGDAWSWDCRIECQSNVKARRPSLEVNTAPMHINALLVQYHFSPPNATAIGETKPRNAIRRSYHSYPSPSND
jgi:hypothetical protein